MSYNCDHFIDGKKISAFSEDYFAVLNPATNEPLAEVAVGDYRDIDRAVEAASKAFDRGNGVWPKMKPSERAKIIGRMADLILAKAEFLGTMESLNVGKLLNDSINRGVPEAAKIFRFFSEFINQHAVDEILRQEAVSLVLREPVGVCGLITPWNSPLVVASGKIAPCLAAGNTCIIKPAIWTPLSVLQLGDIANEAGLPRGVLNIVPGDKEAGSALVRDKRVKKISFTGSRTAGWEVIKDNAEIRRFMPPHLELGGKAPSIVLKDADIGKTVKGVARAAFKNQGQACTAASRLLVHEYIYEEFIERLTDYVKNLKMGNQLDPKTEIGPLVTKEHLKRVENFIAEGLKEGARLLVGGKRPQNPELAKGNYLESVIFEGVGLDSPLWKEEIFGPVLAAMPFKNSREAIRLANDASYGLSANIWSGDAAKAYRIAQELEAGMVWINSGFIRDLRAPFGGRKDSGWGQEGGRYSWDAYTQPKLICIAE